MRRDFQSYNTNNDYEEMVLSMDSSFSTVLPYLL